MILIYTVDWGWNWLVDFNARKTQLVSFQWSNNVEAIDMKIGRTVIGQKLYFSMPGLPFYSILDWRSLVLCLCSTFAHSMKFLSLIAAPYLYKSTKQPCMEYRLVLLDAIWKC